MVKGPDDPIYTRLAEKYNALRLAEMDVNKDFSASSLPVEMVVRNAVDAEGSTYVLEWSGDYAMPDGTTEMVGSQGTAFPYGRPHRLVTCDHVLTQDLEVRGSKIVVDIQSPLVSNLTLEAISPLTGDRFPLKIVQRASAPVDLAQLEVMGGLFGGRYFSGLETPMHRGEKGWLIGYPNWSGGRSANQTHAVLQS